MTKTPIGIQLFSVRGELDKGLAATLKTIAQAGFQGAEPWGYEGKSLSWQGHSATDIRRMYDDNGLRCCGIHLSTDALRGEQLKRTIEFNQTLGNRFLIIAMDKQRMSSLAGIVELATILNEVAEVLKRVGMYTGYHAHGFDFETVEGRIAWDVLFTKTKPEVIMQMDIGNCLTGGGDPICTLKRFPGRARSIHLKDFGGPAGSIIGEGKVDWPTVLEVCGRLHMPDWYVLEQCNETGTGFDIARKSLQAVRAMGF